MGGPASWISDLIGGGAAKIIESTATAAKQFITTDADRAQFDLAIRQANLEVQKLTMDAEAARLGDIASARDMYKGDNSLQKVYALTFLAGYLAMTGAMVYVVVGWLGVERVTIPEWGVALISTAFSAMSTKVSTITDFFFGSSAGSRGKDDALAAAVTQAARERQ